MRYLRLAATCLAALAGPCLHAETACLGSPLAGTVLDATGAIIPGAQISLDGAPAITSGSDGRFRFPCAADGEHTLHVSAESFAAHDIALKLPLRKALDAVLQPRL